MIITQISSYVIKYLILANYIQVICENSNERIQRREDIPFLQTQLLPWQEKSLRSEAEATEWAADVTPDRLRRRWKLAHQRRSIYDRMISRGGMQTFLYLNFHSFARANLIECRSWMMDHGAIKPTVSGCEKKHNRHRISATRRGETKTNLVSSLHPYSIGPKKSSTFRAQVHK